jgi:acyl-CoA thioesterase-1
MYCARFLTGRVLCALAVALVVTGCESRDRQASTAGQDRRPSIAGAPTPAAGFSSARPRIVALGDSITAGLGLPPEAAYPALLQQRLDAAGLAYEVVNAGVSGDTTAGGLRRLDWALDGEVRVLIVALGGNDALRGLPVEQLQRSLDEIIGRARMRGVTVLLAGMEAPPNFGPAYTSRFRQVYRDVAEKHDVAFVPFLLEGVAGVESLNQRDGIHPSEEGARRIADLLWAALQPLVEER